MKKKAEDQAPDVLDDPLDVAVVGAGPAGLLAAMAAKKVNPEAKVVVLESADLTGGRSRSGLHLLPTSFVQHTPLKTGPALGACMVRWDRQWVTPERVDWASKDWAAKLPQWNLYFGKEMVPLLETLTPPPDLAVKFRAPVSRLQKSGDTSMDGWQLEIPGRTVIAHRVIWAAGIAAFQNAVGKNESVAYLTQNPFYDMNAADYRGGISLTLSFGQKPVFDSTFPLGSVFGLPVRHGGKFHLIIGAFYGTGDTWTLSTLTHVPQELLADPGEVMGFQKSLRRALKTLLSESENSDASVAQLERTPERWVVADRVGGHAFGSQWLFNPGGTGGLEFVGDECVTSCSSTVQDTSGVLQPMSFIGF